MSNGVRVDAVRYPDKEVKFVVTIFLDDKGSDWVEFDKEQFEGLITMFQTRLDESEEKALEYSC